MILLYKYNKYDIYLSCLQSISIGKAVNATETPVKEKHVRSILSLFYNLNMSLYLVYLSII